MLRRSVVECYTSREIGNFAIFIHNIGTPIRGESYESHMRALLLRQTPQF
jgi:hypothetical protein